MKSLFTDMDNFIVNEGYESYNVSHIASVQVGSRTYGLHIDESDWDYVGVHLATTPDILEHPDFRTNNQVIRRRFTKDFKEVPNGVKGGDISLDSFEVWKFVTLWLKGAPVAHELLYVEPSITCAFSNDIIAIMKEGISNRLGRATRGMVLHNWKKHKTNRKRTIIAYYRLLQTIFFLKENKFEWNANELWEYGSSLMDSGQAIKGRYTDASTRKLTLTEAEVAGASQDLTGLIDQVDKALIVTKLPDQVPRKYLDEVLKQIKSTRLSII